ncbi:alpha-L-rhamnosidase N-terminal domain-containing protein [uncultured Bacteroides sp.]|uniref:alpha-L-rhamnosidase-related protein n=1 Tax=uncultured Bacteroides sp. TaxID=162156 RepID=UPI0025D81EB8|nr:alpha-L-rhamnosidase N-terminal domain-containing protein [uncultured Bacteroides sp.]
MMIKRYTLLLLVLFSSICWSAENPRNVALDLSPARWIWYPSGRTLQNTFILFRKEIELKQQPQKALGWILADSRYRLFVNGKRVQWGPAPSDPRWQEADPLDLATYLQPGKNVIAVEVCFFGTGDGTHPMGKPGLIVNLDIDGQTVLTDDSWRCYLPHSWQPGKYKRWFLRALQEDFDARLYPYGWDTTSFVMDDNWVKPALVSNSGAYPAVCNWSSEYVWEIFGSREVSEIRRRSVPMMKEVDVPVSKLSESMWIDWKRSPEDYFDMIVPDAFDVIREPVTTHNTKDSWIVTPNHDHAAALTFEFAEQGVGWPCFTIDAPEGTIIELLVHEAHKKGGPAIINSHFNAWTRFVCKEGVNRFETFDFESFRWMQLHIRNFNRPIEISSVGMRRRVYPWKVVPQITLSDDTIQHVMNATVNTLYNCAQETMVDGMARERQQYSGDGSHQLQSVFQTFGDSSLPYRFVNTFSQGSSIDGYFMDSWPAWDRLARTVERQMQLTSWGPIIDHSIGFCFDSYHYYMYSGDKEGLVEVYPRLLKFFTYLVSLTDTGEYLVPAENLGMCSVYIDHEAFKKTKHKQLALNLYIAAMCRNALAPLCRLFGDEAKATEVESYGKRIHEGCIAKFWDKQDKIFVNNLPWREQEGETRYCDRSLATALLYDLCPDGDIRRGLEVLVSSPSEMGLSYPCNAVWRLWALIKYRRMDVVLNDLRNRWGKMSSVWANNTLQEFWVARPDEGSQWSHCAVAPLLALHQGVAGIYPLTPGSDMVRIFPQPGDLSSAAFDVQTSKGAIRFQSTGKVGKRVLKITLPKGVDAELWLDGREKIQSVPVRVEAGGIKVYKISGGRGYEFRLRHS